jgi:hypothetical protein
VCHVAGSGCVEEGVKQPVALGWIDRVVSLFGEMVARSAGQLPCVGFAELEYLGDVAEGVVECLAKQVNGAFDGGQPLHQKLDGALQCLAAFCLQRWIDGGEIALREPSADTDLATSAGRGCRVERDPRRDGHQERDTIPDSGLVCALPADPHVLNDVFGVGCTTQQLVGDPEESKADAFEVCYRLRPAGTGHRAARDPTIWGGRRDGEATGGRRCVAGHLRA